MKLRFGTSHVAATGKNAADAPLIVGPVCVIIHEGQ